MLQARNTPLVHIASHFCFQSGNAEGSFQLGDDSKFSLHDMSTYPGLYAGVDLLVLSACQTAALGVFTVRFVVCCKSLWRNSEP